ncbi:hypothetical protein [Streptomyces sp. 4R-3d]|uniref:hypothetical protein n=1 Tax=Streptomyces sp. 4R-3d TaxID=2559605 RepID=UPI0010718AFD|nr:hypothetical protein [Streptomyces sp. 4R-3d]TFI30151.1 hypothetical protein E4P36_05215 [Streptomyces sp. 4R-3d]
MTALLADLLGPRLATLLTTPQQQIQARRLFDLIATSEGGDIARAWLIGANPNLGDQAPLNAIINGQGDQALAAARSYLNT